MDWKTLLNSKKCAASRNNGSDRPGIFYKTHVAMCVIIFHFFFKIRVVSIEYRETKTSGRSQIAQAIQQTNQISKQIHVAEAKRGKTRAWEPRLVLFVLVIG